MLVVARETEGLWENWLVTKTISPPLQWDTSRARVVDPLVMSHLEGAFEALVGSHMIFSVLLVFLLVVLLVFLGLRMGVRRWNFCGFPCCSMESFSWPLAAWNCVADFFKARLGWCLCGRCGLSSVFHVL